MSDDKPFPVIGIGASAGGVEALTTLFRRLPPEPGAAFIVVTHLAPNRESMLPEILSRCTSMQVVAAENDQAIEKDRVYLNSPNSLLMTTDGHITLQERDREHNVIDIFLVSMAKDFAERSIAVILSGTGTDGSIGVKAVREAGGFTVAQGADGGVHSHQEMPAAAVATGYVDCVAPVEELAGQITGYVASFLPLRRAIENQDKAAEVAAAKDAICSILRDRMSHDFSHYKDRTFLRRVGRRMQVREVDEIGGYVDLIGSDPDEAVALFRDLLVGVTNFFRDAESFEAIDALVIPRLFEGRESDDTVRVWVPGCSTGEEAYSIAMLLREGVEKAGRQVRLQIFATDVDDKAVAVARAGTYPERLLETVSPQRRERFFVRDGANFTVAKEIRDVCLFSSHSIIRDPPFSHIDLISCRNLLIYFNAELQNQVFPLFYYALRPGGYLFLGISENISQHTDLFTPLEKRCRIFQRSDTTNRRQPVFPIFSQATIRRPGRAAYDDVSAGDRAALLRRVEARVLTRFAPAHVLINREWNIVHFSARTGKYLEQPPGAPNRNLLTMVRHGLGAALRSALEEALQTGRPALREDLAMPFEGGIQAVTITVEGAPDGGGEALWLVVFDDIGPVRLTGAIAADAVAGRGDDAAQQMEQELRETHERLQVAVEEHETSVEELKSANEELLSVNEELQSANEELETSKEELQSVNEELHTVNSELSSKVEELDRASSDLKNLFDSTEIAMIFLDRNMMVRSFTPAVGELFRLIPADRGRPLSDITSMLDYDRLEADVRHVLEQVEPLEKYVNRRGGDAHYLMRILPYRTMENKAEGVSVTFIDVSEIARAEAHQRGLIAELNHRVKNMLAVVAALAEQMAARSNSLEEYSQAFIGRILGMARTHEILSKAGWADVDIAGLLDAELQGFVADRHRIALNGPNVRLQPRTTTTLGAAVYELATNAVKYGALSTPEGTVSIDWSIEQPPDGPRLSLTWSESGGPPVVPPRKKGLGTQLIVRGIEYELGGKASVEFRPEGLLSVLSFPVDAGQPAARNRRRG